MNTTSIATSTIDVSNMGSPFYATKKLFTEYVAYSAPLSYDDWMTVSENQKAAVLYVQFFEQITLAWYKVRSFYAQEEDGVSTMMQYLQKNVPLIKENRKKFTPQYIYKVAYNCLYCICHDIKRDKMRWETECSNIVACGDDVLDLFDTVAAEPDFLDGYELRNNFWGALEALGDDAQTVVADILEGTSTRAINKKRRAEILDKIREVLTPFAAALGY